MRFGGNNERLKARAYSQRRKSKNVKNNTKQTAPEKTARTQPYQKLVRVMIRESAKRLAFRVGESPRIPKNQTKCFKFKPSPPRCSELSGIGGRRDNGILEYLGAGAVGYRWEGRASWDTRAP